MLQVTRFTPEIAGKAPEPLGTKKGATEAQIYTINALSYHPIEGTCASAGSDGTLIIWDINNKKLLKNHDLKHSDGRTNQIMPITATAFNYLNGGKILAYAVSYDWSHGYKGNFKGHPNKVMLHALSDDEIKKRPKS